MSPFAKGILAMTRGPDPAEAMALYGNKAEEPGRPNRTPVEDLNRRMTKFAAVIVRLEDSWEETDFEAKRQQSSVHGIATSMLTMGWLSSSRRLVGVI